MTTTKQPGAELPLQQLESVVLRFAGDSGDGMQITGGQFTLTSALVGNDLATLPDFPAEIRAPAGTRPGVSGFQLQFSSSEIHTPGDQPDVLVAMNPAALIVNIKELRAGGIVVVNTGNFKEIDLKKAQLATNPLTDGTLSGYRVIEVDINQRVAEALAGLAALVQGQASAARTSTRSGLMYWVYSRPLEPTIKWLDDKFKDKPELADANKKAMRAGFNAGDIHELFQGRYEVLKVEGMPPGTYRNIMGNQALSMGLVAGAELAGLRLVLGSYPITPASTILETLAGYKNFGVVTFQAEDEIAAVCAAIGASYAGCLGMTSTSGPGMALKTEAIGLAVSIETPLVIVDIQRAGPSTGMPTKTEQSDLLQSIFGRNARHAAPGDRLRDAERRLLRRHRGLSHRDAVHDAGDRALRQLHRQRLGALEAAGDGRAEAFPGEVPDRSGGSPDLRTRRARRPRVGQAGHAGHGVPHRRAREIDLPGNISYDPGNHQQMTDERHRKVMNVRDSIPTPAVHGAASGDLLVVGWGSTAGIITGAVELAEKARPGRQPLAPAPRVAASLRARRDLQPLQGDPRSRDEHGADGARPAQRVPAAQFHFLPESHGPTFLAGRDQSEDRPDPGALDMAEASH